MKVFYNSKIAKVVTFMKGFATIMLFGAVFTERKELSKTTLGHEAAHVEQYQTCFTTGLAMSVISMFICFAFNVIGWWMLSLIAVPILLYYVMYVIEFVVRLIQYWGVNKAYRNISFEREAYDLECEWMEDCQDRRSASSFSWFRYYRK